MNNNKETLAFDGFHKIKIVDVEIKGKTVKREILVMKNAVAGIVLDEKNNICLVRQFRAPIGDFVWEIPAGVLDKPELDIKETLLEELKEECEIHRSDIVLFSEKPVRYFHMVLGSSPATMSIYLVKVKYSVNKLVDDVDVEEVRWFSFEEFEEMIESGLILDNKTQIAYDILWKTLKK